MYSTPQVWLQFHFSVIVIMATYGPVHTLDMLIQSPSSCWKNRHSKKAVVTEEPSNASLPVPETTFLPSAPALSSLGCHVCEWVSSMTTSPLPYVYSKELQRQRPYELNSTPNNYSALYTKHATQETFDLLKTVSISHKRYSTYAWLIMSGHLQV